MVGRLGSQIGRFFCEKKKSVLVSKIVSCSTEDHCRRFYLPVYGQLEVNEIFQFHSSMFWWVLCTAKCAGNSTHLLQLLPENPWPGAVARSEASQEIFISSREINLYRLDTFATMVANRPFMYNRVPAFWLLWILLCLQLQLYTSIR